MNKNLKVKWNKDIFDVDVTGDTQILDLKRKIFSLKNIDPQNQKLMLKGKVLEDNCQLSTIQDNSQITLLGKANEVVDESQQKVNTEKPKIKFLEDLTEKEIADIKRQKGEIVVFGLQNLGNTCYFNSVIQSIGRVPELRKALIDFTSKGVAQTMQQKFSLAMGMNYLELDKTADTVVPQLVVNILRTINPMFAERERNSFKQQDAVECLEFVFSIFKEVLKYDSSDKFATNLIDELFGIQYDIKLKSIGEEKEEIKEKKDISLKLNCYIDSQTGELLEGLKKGITEVVELRSDFLGRNVNYEKTQFIGRIPPYLCVQFMRFFWKQTNENIFGQEGQGGKSKILKSVLFSKVLDIYDLCSDSTKELLNLGRSIETKIAEKDKNYSMTNLNNPVTENMIPTGRYLLISLITHKGRSSDSGHYIGWTMIKDDKWVKYDDDEISYKNNQEIQELKGGGDHHMAYICFYKRLEVPFQEI